MAKYIFTIFSHNGQWAVACTVFRSAIIQGPNIAVNAAFSLGIPRGSGQAWSQLPHSFGISFSVYAPVGWTGGSPLADLTPRAEIR